MKPHLCALVLLAVVFGSAWSSVRAQPSQDPVLKLLQATFTGTARCPTEVALELTIVEIESGGLLPVLKGRLKMMPAGGGKGRSFNTRVQGLLHREAGYITLSSPPPSASMPNLRSGEIPVADIWRRLVQQERPARLQLLMAHSGDGRSFVGSIEGDEDQCEALRLARADGSALPGLPALTGEYAEAASRMPALPRADGKGPTTFVPRPYWLLLAAERGQLDARLTLGRGYESGTVLARDPVIAAGHYRIGADAGDARAQKALAKLLEKGADGVPANPNEATRLNAAADATLAAAARVCTAPDTVVAVQRLIDAYSRDPGLMLGRAVLGAVTGINIDEGGFKLVNIATEQVSVLDRPFRCLAIGRRVDPRLSSHAPSFEYVGEDQEGRSLYVDRQFEAALSRAVAQGMQQLMQAAPVAQMFSVSALGGNKWRLQLVAQGNPLAGQYSTDVRVP